VSKIFIFSTNKTFHKMFNSLVGYSALAGALLMLVPFVLLIYQGYFWLKMGHWTPFPAGKVLVPILPDSFLSWLSADSWVGLKRIIIGAMDIPIGVYSFILGISIFLFCASIGWEVDESANINNRKS